MNSGAKWGIAFGVGIPTVLILIGLIVLITKFFMKRCRKKAWDDISVLPKHMDSSENSTNPLQVPKHRSSDRQLLYQSATNNAMEISDSHISIPIDENDFSHGQHRTRRTTENQQNDIQRAIDQVQKEFEQSVWLS